MMAKIPRFRTEQEMRKFWDTHDSAEYFEDMEDERVEVEFNRDKGVLVIWKGSIHRTPRVQTFNLFPLRTNAKLDPLHE